MLFKLSFPSFLGVRYNGTSCPQTKSYRTVQKIKEGRDGKALQPLRQTSHSGKIRAWTSQIQQLMVFSKSKWGKAWTLSNLVIIKKSSLSSKISDKNVHSECQSLKLEEVSNFTVYLTVSSGLFVVTFLVSVLRTEPRALVSTGEHTPIPLLFMSKL